MATKRINTRSVEELIKAYTASNQTPDVYKIGEGAVRGMELEDSILTNKMNRDSKALDIQKQIQALKDQRQQKTKEASLTDSIQRKNEPAAVIGGQPVMPSEVKGLPETIAMDIDSRTADAFPKETAQDIFKQRLADNSQEGKLQIQKLKNETKASSPDKIKQLLQVGDRTVGVTYGGQIVDVPLGGKATSVVGKRLSDETVKQFADFDVLNSQMKTVRQSYKPEYVGPVDSRLGQAKQITGIGASKERSDFYSNINSIRNQLVYLRSGKQINEQEYARLLKELPDEHTSPVDFSAKLDNFEKVFKELRQSRVDSFKQSGYVEIPELKDDAPQGSGGVPTVGSTFNGGKVLKVTKVN